MAKQADQTALQQLKGDIKAKNPGRCYVFYGEEMFLLRHYLGQLQKLLVDELTESFNFTRLNQENFQLQTFVDAVESFPMMAETTMVQVDDVDLFKLPEGERDKIAEVLADIPDHCTVVFTYETVSWKPEKKSRALYDAMQKFANVVEFGKQSQRDLVAWIQRHFAARKKVISPELCTYLLEITDGTMTALAGEISKVASYSGAEHICKADIDAVVEPVLSAVVFQMTDLLSQGKYGPALQKLQTLLKMQQEPIAILGAIGNHYRQLSAARVLLDHGKNVGELLQLYPKMRDFAGRKIMDAARRHSGAFCAKASELILQTDVKMKTSYDDPQRLLELLVLQLAQEARRD